MKKSATATFLVAALAAAMCMAPLAAAWPQAATQARPVSRVLGADDRREALKAIEARIEKGYVHMDRRAEIIARLERQYESGKYNTDDPVEFARRVTGDFQALTNDVHLYVRFEPEWYAASIAPRSPGEEERENAFENEIARNTNHGLSEMKVLMGNIRYLKIDGFDWIEDETPLAYDGAMRFLKGGAAVIIDLRGNTGGWSQSAKYLLSHFLDGDTLFATYRFANGAEEQQRAADYVAAGRIKGKPLYILIDHHSRSAAEQVAYNVQQFRLGELIGATTAGASYTSEDAAIAPGFRLSVSMSEEIHAISHTAWEVVGVKPTFEVDPATALEVAELHAIDRLAPTAMGINKNQLLWAKPAVLAAMAPASLTQEQLKAYVGAYGAASIRLKDDALWLFRTGRDPYRLKPMTNSGLFQAVDAESLRVQIGPTALAVLHIDPGQDQIFKK